jgi:hypothetical protein
MEKTDQYRKAERRVEAKLAFIIHALVYVLVNAVLIIINFATEPAHLWFQWPLIGWGAGLLLHGLLVLMQGRGRSIKKRMIARELAKRR